ncbi:MAG: polyisoprenoid-binding protein [Crocinitomicaceae bacterium]|nr:polyisoprenoid-binding protein [Crocinitomicaceae bacterium]
MANTTKWVLDPTHSELLFKVKHLMITNVKGEFRNFEGTIVAQGDDFSSAKVTANVAANSVFTNNEDRDNHLKSEDFFNVEQFENLTFEGTKFEKVDSENYRLTGNLTIIDVTKEITLEVAFGGIAVDPWGNKKAGFSLDGQINRKDWGLNWNAALETGGVLVSDTVKISAELQFVVGAE